MKPREAIAAERRLANDCCVTYQNFGSDRIIALLERIEVNTDIEVAFPAVVKISDGPEVFVLRMRCVVIKRNYLNVPSAQRIGQALSDFTSFIHFINDTRSATDIFAVAR